MILAKIPDFGGLGPKPEESQEARDLERFAFRGAFGDSGT